MIEIKKINSPDEFDKFIKESENGKLTVLKVSTRNIKIIVYTYN